MTIALLLQSAGGGLGSVVFQLAPLFLIFGVFYFLIIVPQRKRQQALQQTISALKAGDRIVTTGGIIATVTAVRDNSLVVRSADKTMLEISRASVSGLFDDAAK